MGERARVECLVENAGKLQLILCKWGLSECRAKQLEVNYNFFPFSFFFCIIFMIINKEEL